MNCRTFVYLNESSEDLRTKSFSIKEHKVQVATSVSFSNLLGDECEEILVIPCSWTNWKLYTKTLSKKLLLHQNTIEETTLVIGRRNKPSSLARKESENADCGVISRSDPAFSDTNKPLGTIVIGPFSTVSEMGARFLGSDTQKFSFSSFSRNGGNFSMKVTNKKCPVKNFRKVDGKASSEKLSFCRWIPRST